MLSVSSQRKYNFYHQNALLDAFRTNSRNIIGRNPSMVIPLLANQDLTPMLLRATANESCIIFGKSKITGETSVRLSATALHVREAVDIISYKLMASTTEKEEFRLRERSE